MNICPQLSHCLAILCLALAPSALMAQRPHASEAVKPAPGTYDVANDVSLTGTILSYTENSQTPPIGAHVFLQTASGNLDVHIGDARLLHLAKMTLSPGITVRFVGQPRTAGKGSVFLARLIQVNTQVLAVRSDRGLPLAPSGIRATANKDLVANVPADRKGGVQ
jgi:hypothetical protein